MMAKNVGSVCDDMLCQVVYMGVSENSVPLNPMVNDHYPY